MTKIREYFLLKINQFKKPLANYQIPQNAMLRSISSRIKVFVLKKISFLSMPPFRFKFYFRFLQSVNREVAREVRKIKNKHRSIFKIRS